MEHFFNTLHSADQPIAKVLFMLTLMSFAVDEVFVVWPFLEAYKTISRMWTYLIFPVFFVSLKVRIVNMHDYIHNIK